MDGIYDDLAPNDFDGAYDGLINLSNEIKTLIQQFPNETAGQLAQRF